MLPGASVQSIDALLDWHNSLCLYRQEIQDVLSLVALETRRAFDWVDETQHHWKSQLRRAEDDVVQAKAELNRKQTPNFAGRIPDTSVEEENLDRAKARLEYIRDQIDICHSWSAKLPKMISEEYEGSARKLGNFNEIELANAIARLNQQILSIQAYLAVAPVAAPKETSAESQG